MDSGGAVQDVPVLEAWLSVPTVFPQQQQVGQVRDITGGQAQGLDLGQLPVRGFGRDESTKSREGRVDAVSSVSFTRVRRLPLFAYA